MGREPDPLGGTVETISPERAGVRACSTVVDELMGYLESTTHGIQPRDEALETSVIKLKVSEMSK